MKRTIIISLYFILVGCSNKDEVKLLIDTELAGRDEHVLNTEEVREIGMYCKVFKVTTDQGHFFYSVIRFKNGGVDDKFHPNYSFISSNSEKFEIRDSAMCN